jgi:hypothetical protein
MRTDAWFGDCHCRQTRQPALALLQCAEALKEEASDELSTSITFSQQPSALDNLGFLACNRDIRHCGRIA